MAVTNEASSATTPVQETIETLSSTPDLSALISSTGKKRGRLRRIDTSLSSSSVPRQEPEVSVQNRQEEIPGRGARTGYSLRTKPAKKVIRD